MTKEQQEVIQAEYLTTGAKALSERLGLTIDSVYSAANRMGLSTRKRPTVVTPEIVAAVCSRYEAEGAARLSEELNLSSRTVGRIAGDHGIKTNVGHVSWGQRRADENRSSNIKFFDTWSNSMAYTLGFIFADGHINKAHTLLSIGLHIQDKAIVDYIREALEAKTTVKVVTVKQTTRNSAPQARLTISSKRLCEGLIRRGCLPGKSNRDDPFPEVPEEYLPHFLRGAFDGDGTINKGKNERWSFAYCGSQKFVSGFADHVARLSGTWRRPVNKQGSDKCWACSWQSHRDIRKVYDALYPSGQDYFKGPRKFEKWQHFLNDYAAQFPD